MKQSNTSRYAYLAGLIDGEGTISIKCKKPMYGRSKQHNLFISINQKDGKMIDWLYGNFGGMVSKKFYPPSIVCPNGNWGYNWWIQDYKTFQILKRILPFLTTKKKQAETGIRFGYRKRQKNGRNKLGQIERLSEDELQKREELKQLLHKQKKIYLKSAVVETKREASSKEDKQ